MGRTIILALLAILLITPPTLAVAQDDTAEITFWESVKDSTDAEELDAYLEAYPNGKFSPLAKIRLKKLRKADAVSPEQPASAETAGTPAADASETAVGRRDIVLAVKLGAHPDNPEAGRLGVQIIGLPGEAASALKISEAGAVFINNVQKDTAAEAYGMSVGDIVIAVDGTPTNDIQTLVKLVAAHAPGETATLKIVRLAKSPIEFVQAIRQEAEKLKAPGLSAFVATLYSSGLGAAAPADPQESFSWTRKAAIQGHPASMRAVGNHYANVDKNPKEAFKWYRKAADKGDPGAMDSLGNAYKSGQGVAKDAEQAMQWFRKAAEIGNASAMYSLGLQFHLGQGVDKDLAESKKWFRKSADLGNAGAMIWLGFLGEDREKKNYAEAIKWYRLAAEKGSWDGMLRLGRMYYNGHGVTKDKAQALQWYRKAGDLGYLPAMNSVGYAYANGEGIEKDPVEAMKWYRKAADKGYAVSIANVGALYEAGSGVEKDMTQAMDWYRQAADKDNTWAMVQMAIAFDEGRGGIEKDPTAAAQNLLKAYFAGNVSAQTNLFRESNKWNRDTRRAVQEELSEAGVYSGSIDGKLGPSTRRSIKALKAQKEAETEDDSESGAAYSPAAIE